jgi:hypothetical protein
MNADPECQPDPPAARPVATLTARVTFAASLVLPAPAVAARLEVEPIRVFTAAQQVAPDRVRARLTASASRGPAEPRPL